MCLRVRPVRGKKNCTHCPARHSRSPNVYGGLCGCRLSRIWIRVCVVCVLRRATKRSTERTDRRLWKTKHFTSTHTHFTSTHSDVAILQKLMAGIMSILQKLHAVRPTLENVSLSSLGDNNYNNLHSAQAHQQSCSRLALSSSCVRAHLRYQFQFPSHLRTFCTQQQQRTSCAATQISIYEPTLL